MYGEIIPPSIIRRAENTCACKVLLATLINIGNERIIIVMVNIHITLADGQLLFRRYHGLTTALGHGADDKALINDQIATDHGITENGEHTFLALDALIHTHRIGSKQAEHKIHGIAVQHRLDGGRAGDGLGKGGQVGNNGVGVEDAAVFNGSDVGLPASGCTLNTRSLSLLRSIPSAFRSSFARYNLALAPIAASLP